jgi:thioredoxin reductase (NADPH)
MVLTHEVANYPGVEKTSGYQLANIMRKQAIDFGCDIKSNVRISALDIEDEDKTVTLEGGIAYSAHAVILAPGGRSKTLGIPGEDQFKGKGISYCATCDGDFFSGKEIIVVGGGNSALEEAVSLTRYASRVTIVHQFDHFQAFSHAVEEAAQNPKIDFIMESVLVRYNGTEQIESVDIKDLQTGNIRKFRTDGVFVFIGYVPNTAFLRTKLHLNARDEIVVTKDMETSVKGVYAAGDSVEKRYRQISTAVGDATVAALAASEYTYGLKEKYKHELITG